MALSVNDIAEVIADAITAATAPLKERLAVVEGRLAVQETKSAAGGPRWQGIYHEGRVYEEGSLLTHNGSLWLAKRTSDERPGTSRDYTLICKQGQVPRE